MAKMAKQEKQELDGELFFKLNQGIIEREKQRRGMMIDNIKDIAEVFDKKLFNVEFENFAGFLGQIEVYYTRTEVYRHLIIKKRLIDEFQFNPEEFYDVHITRLESISKFAKDKTQAEELIGKARVLTSRDWRNEINVLRGKPQLEDCRHNMEYYEVCKTCGFKIRNK